MAEAIFNDVFGRLTWDDEFGCWTGGIDWPPGLYTEVAIWQPDDNLAAGLRMACEGLDWLQSHEVYARRCVAGEMRAVYNAAWRHEEPPITEDEFISRIELVWIGFRDDGSLLLSYDGQEMFSGQLIDGDFAADGSFRGAKLAG